MKITLYTLVFIVSCLGVASLGQVATAAPMLLGSYESWKVHSFDDKGGEVCFISSQPKKQAGKFKKRGEVFFFVTRWSSDKDKNVVSVSNGYTFKRDSRAILTIDGKKFTLFTQGEMAWTKDQPEDDAITAELQKAATMTVQGTSRFGTLTTDTYALKGIAAAYQTLSEDCGKKK